VCGRHLAVPPWGHLGVVGSRSMSPRRVFKSACSSTQQLGSLPECQYYCGTPFACSQKEWKCVMVLRSNSRSLRLVGRCVDTWVASSGSMSSRVCITRCAAERPLCIQRTVINPTSGECSVVDAQHTGLGLILVLVWAAVDRMRSCFWRCGELPIAWSYSARF
jgi:hypothetical protein